MTKYRPVGEQHAIEQAIVGVRLNEKADEARYRDAISISSSLAERFSLPGRMQLDPMSLMFGRQSISHGFGGVTESHGGHLFQQVKPDGSAAQELTLEASAVIFRTMAYRRWDDVKNIIQNVIIPITSALTGNDLSKISVIEFRCIDRFINDGETRLPLSSLIAPDCLLIPSYLKEKSENLHCHLGWFEEINVDERYLYNLNIGVADSEEHNQVAQILQVISRQFKSGMPNADDALAVEQVFDDLHARDKGLLKTLLSEELQIEISLEGETASQWS